MGLHLFLINAFVYISSVFYVPFISSYYAGNGITPAQIGVLLMIGPITAIIVQPLWGRLSDATGRRKLVLALAVAGSGLSMLIYYAGNSFRIFFIAAVAVNVFMTVVVPLCDALIINQAELLGIPFSVVRLGGTLGFSVMAVIAGNLLKKYPDMQFALSSIGYAILLILIAFLPRDSARGRSIPKTGRKTRMGIHNIFVSKEIYLVLSFVLISQIGLSFYSGFMGPYLIKQGQSQKEIGVMSCLSALSEVPVLLIIEKVRKKFGEVRVLMFSCFMMALRIFIFTGETLLSAGLAQILQGTTYMTVYYCAAVYIATNVKKGMFSLGQGVLGVVQTGIGAVIGTSVGGILVNSIGFKKSFWVVASTLVVLTSMLGMYHEKRVAELKLE